MFLTILSGCQNVKETSDTDYANYDDILVYGPWTSRDPVIVTPSAEDFYSRFDYSESSKFFAPKVEPKIPTPVRELDGEHVVALLLPLSGKGAAIGQDLLNAAQLAMFDSADKNFILRPYDTNGTADGAKEAAYKAVDDDADLILGPVFSESVEAVASVADRADIPVIAFSNNKEVADTDVFLMGVLPRYQIERVLYYAVEQGHRRFALLAPDTEYGRIAAEVLEELDDQFEGIEVTKSAFFSTHQKDFTSLLKDFTDYDRRMEEKKEREQREAEKQAAEELGQIMQDDLNGEETAEAEEDEIDYGFDAVLLPVSGNKLQQIAPMFAYYEVDLKKVRLLGTGLWDNDSLGREPSILRAWYAAPKRKSRLNFEKKFKQNFGKTPPRITTLAYDATVLAALLAKQGIPYTPESLTSFSGFEGLDGLFKFNPDGTNSRALAVMKILRRYHKTISAAPNEPIIPFTLPEDLQAELFVGPQMPIIEEENVTPSPTTYQTP